MEQYIKKKNEADICQLHFFCLNYVRTDSDYITLFLLIFSVLPKIIANCKIDNPNCQSNKIYNKRFVRKIVNCNVNYFVNNQI